MYYIKFYSVGKTVQKIKGIRSYSSFEQITKYKHFGFERCEFSPLGTWSGD